MRAALLRYRWQVQTAAYFGVMVSLGLANAALGPTLPRVAAQAGVTIGAVSILFSARSLGYLCGSLLSGRLYDRLPGHPVMAAARQSHSSANAGQARSIVLAARHSPTFFALLNMDAASLQVGSLAAQAFQQL